MDVSNTMGAHDLVRKYLESDAGHERLAEMVKMAAGRGHEKVLACGHFEVPADGQQEVLAGGHVEVLTPR